MRFGHHAEAMAGNSAHGNMTGRPLTPVVAPNRFFTDEAGRTWRVWLELPARHQLRQGERRQVLSFVAMDEPSHQVMRRVPEGWGLEGAGEGELGKLLGEGSP